MIDKSGTAYRYDELKTGEGLLYDNFGGKFLISGEEIEEELNNDGQHIRRLK